MKGKNFSKLIAGVMGAAMAFTASVPAVHAVAPADAQLTNKVTAAKEGTVVYECDFESDTDLQYWANRGGDDTTELSITPDAADSGKSSMLASGRSETWNGPSLRLDKFLKPDTQYYLSASVKGQWYTNCTLSSQFTIDGEDSYNNMVKDIKSASGGGDGWGRIENVAISYSSGMDAAYIYFESNNTENILVDNVKIVEAAHVDIEKDLPSLSEIYKDKFKVGTALTPDNLASQPFMDLVQKHFGESITVGNQMKPDYVLNQKRTLAYLEETGDDEHPQISFSQAKPILDYARKYGIPVRVHTLVWYSQTPEWFFKEDYDAEKPYVTPEKMLKRMENYIKSYFETLTALYPDIDFYACDVVNEAFDNDGNPRKPGHPAQENQYAASDWVAVFGDNSFIDYAFRYARQYAPEGCKLYYNDFNEYMGKKDAICEMAERLKKEGVIDGIGMQSHLDVRQSMDAAFPSLGQYEIALKQFTETGLDVQITELDVTVQENSGDKYFDVQSTYYKGLFDIYEKYSDKISAVIFWGVIDTESWRKSQNPLIFDGDFMAKPAFKSIVGSKTAADPVRTTISGGNVTTTTTTTTATTTTSTTTGGIKDITWGDTNCDGTVELADAILIMQTLANPNKYSVTDQGKENGDVDKATTGLTSNDALFIQEYLLHLRPTLDPVSNT